VGEATVIYYANPSTDAIRDEMSRGGLGCIITPKQGNRTFTDDGWDTIADNGCFSAKWTAATWWPWLLDQDRRVRFAVAPDVFDPTGAPCHDATLDRWREWGPKMERHGFTPAFVCQVGATPDNVPDAPVLFLGGTTEWKLGLDAWAITAAAKGEGRWVHMGRVNSRRRMVTAIEMGVDSCDGTFLTFGPDINLPRLLRYLADAHNHARPALPLFGGSP
jgi:hypothetical protein